MGVDAIGVLGVHRTLSCFYGFVRISEKSPRTLTLSPRGKGVCCGLPPKEEEASGRPLSPWGERQSEGILSRFRINRTDSSFRKKVPLRQPPKQSRCEEVVC